jgi:hypothetical protein
MEAAYPSTGPALTGRAAVGPGLQLGGVFLRYPPRTVEFHDALVVGRRGGDPARNLLYERLLVFVKDAATTA